MNRTTHCLASACWLVAVLLLLSCGPGGQSATLPAVSIATPTTAVALPTPSTTATPPQPTVLSPTDTAESAVPPAVTDTPRPSPSPTPTALRPTDTAEPTVPPAATDTPRPSPSPTPTAAVSQPITVVNASHVALLDRLGTGALQDMAWLPDGQTVVVAFYSGLSLCDAGTLQERRFIPVYGSKAGLAASPDGRHMAMIAEDGVQLWDINSGQVVLTLEAPEGGANLIAFGAGGQTLAISGPEVKGEPSSETVAVWDIAGVLDGSTPGGRLLYRLEGLTGVSGLALSPGGEVLVTTRWYDSSQAPGTTYLELWDAMTGEPLPLEGDLGTAPDGLRHLAFTPDGRLLVGSEGFNIHIWDAATGKLLQTLVSDSSVYSLALSADGRWLAAGSLDKSAQVWDVPTGTLRTTLAGHTDWVIRVAFDPAPSSRADTASLATATTRDGVQLWDVASGQRIAARRPVGHANTVAAVAYSPDGEILATASPDQTVWLWDADSGQALRMLDASGMGIGEWCACIWSLAFSSDGKTLATGSTDARVRLWDVKSGKLLQTSQALGDLIYGLGFSPDGQRLAAGDTDGLLLVWDLAVPLDAGPLLSLDSGGVIVSLSFNPAPPSPGGHVLATGSGFGAIRIWDIDTGTLVREMEGSHNSVRAVYSPDGRILAAGDSGWAEEFPIRLWDPGSGELLRSLHGHTKDVSGLAFTPDGQVLASGDWDGFVRLWDVATGEQLQTLQQPWSAKVMAFRPDGRRLATAGFDGLAWIWGVP